MIIDLKTKITRINNDTLYKMREIIDNEIQRRETNQGVNQGALK